MRGMWGLSAMLVRKALNHKDTKDTKRVFRVLCAFVVKGSLGAIIRRDEGDSHSRARRVREAGDGRRYRSRRARWRGGRARARGGAQSSRHLVAARCAGTQVSAADDSGV